MTQLAAFPADKLFPLWCRALHLLAQRPRVNLVSDLAVLSYVIEVLGGSEGRAVVADVIAEVGSRQLFQVYDHLLARPVTRTSCGYVRTIGRVGAPRHNVPCDLCCRAV